MNTVLYLIACLIAAAMSVGYLPMQTFGRPSRNVTKIKRTMPKCSLGRWVKNGTSRFWKRQCNETRRIYREDLSIIMGKPHDSEYRPNYGYEPYWSGGGWVFDLRPTALPGTGDNFACGQVCPEYQKAYGKVCGRNKRFKYKTFENYCMLKKEDCTFLERWMMLYRGECQPDLHTYTMKGFNDKAAINKTLSSRISFMQSKNFTSKFFGFPEPYKPWTEEVK